MVPVVVTVVGGGIVVVPPNDLVAQNHRNNIDLKKLGQIFQNYIFVLPTSVKKNHQNISNYKI